MRGGMRLALSAISAATAVLLGGCAETTLAVHTAKQLTRNEAATRQGVYKVGEPYQINGVWYYPAEDYEYNETGIASFYGGEAQGVNFHGRVTANGEIYDMNALTAAHQTLPLPSLVRVTNLENGRSIVLRVNDRGPFVRGRIIDVSRRAAQLLGFESQGTARVRVEILPEESRQLKEAMLRGQGGSPEIQTVAAAPRAEVVSDALPPPPGARAAGGVGSATLPPPSAILPPAPEKSSASSAAEKRSRHNPPQTVAARPAAPVVVEPSTSTSAATAPVAQRQLPAPKPAPVSAPTEVAALPVAQQAAATPVVLQTPVSPTSIFIQAGAFANYDNAYRLSVRLSRYGKTTVTPVNAGAQQLYRVRIGPVPSVQEADLLLAEVTSVVPEARIVVD